jgi:hypothetical protein
MLIVAGAGRVGLSEWRQSYWLRCSAVVAQSHTRVLTHEEIVDLVWTDEIRPLLLMRFPALTEDQAHGYAYGGAVIQDLGYYPFGSVEFSNLVHYVRSGDFVRDWFIPIRCQPNDPENDTVCTADSQERHGEGIA